MHGDIDKPESLVFTRGDYDSHVEDYQALHGVVQSLMLTNHLLFVGFGLTDTNFLKMARAVRKVRAEADEPVETRAGTALMLNESPIEHELAPDLTFLPMLKDGDERSAARILEVFLDRLAWKAATTQSLSASYLLDSRFESGLTSEDRELRDKIVSFEESLTPQAKMSPAWDQVRTLLVNLGREDK